MASFLGRLTGQGFFPGGDGLWRGDSRIKLNSTSPFPVGGIMFLGNDFGTLQTFDKTLRTGYENVLTWRNLKRRLIAAEISGDVGFYTNAVLGLRTDKKALDYLDWSYHPYFCQFCGDFLRLKLEAMRPRPAGRSWPKTEGHGLLNARSRHSRHCGVEKSRPEFDEGGGNDSGSGVARDGICCSPLIHTRILRRTKLRRRKLRVV